MHTKVEKELYRKDEVSIIQVVYELIQHAFEARASDIHIDPLADTIRVRFRIDGIMVEHCTLPKNISYEIISRIKVLSNLRTDEHQMPQDGRFNTALTLDTSIDIRVSIIPAFYGETVVLRLLPKERKKNSLLELGFCNDDAEKIHKELNKTTGIILVTGPTGSGKTTTLYTLIQLLRKDTVIVTIEDPIEYALDSVRQIQINSRVGLTFAHGLRAVLRQDPDTIMIGEIRDKETASIAVNSALTGHLIVSTLHTNDAVSALPRLFDMEVEPYLIASVVNLIIAQRLVRKLCTFCKVEKSISSEEAAILKPHNKNHTIYTASKGCKECSKTGYKGRVAIYELIFIDEEIRELILQKSSHQKIKNVLLSRRQKTLAEDGREKIMQGITTLEEIMRVTHE